MADIPPKLPPKLIDAGAHCRYRARASAGFAGVNYLKMAAVERLVDRLEGMKGGFALALDVGGASWRIGGVPLLLAVKLGKWLVLSRHRLWRR